MESEHKLTNLEIFFVVVSPHIAERFRVRLKQDPPDYIHASYANVSRDA